MVIRYAGDRLLSTVLFTVYDGGWEQENSSFEDLVGDTVCQRRQDNNNNNNNKTTSPPPPPASLDCIRKAFNLSVKSTS